MYKVQAFERHTEQHDEAINKWLREKSKNPNFKPISIAVSLFETPRAFANREVWILYKEKK